MEFKDLVNFRNELFNHSSSVLKESADVDIKKIINFIQTETCVPDKFVNNLQEKHKNIQETFDNFESILTASKEHVQQSIKDIEPQWFEESRQRYDNYKTSRITQMRDIVAKNIFIEQTLNTASSLSDNKKQLIHLRIGGYSDWRYSAMIIRPGLESFIDNMVANDPLYLVDEYPELLSPFMKKFSTIYQNRLRPYTIDESSDNALLEKLPKNQFRLCLAFNYFDRKPIEVIARYLEEIFEKLHPGGILGMTFTDCDRRSGIILVEKFAAFYTPGNAILSIAQNIGYKEVFRWSDDGPTTWIELQRPGTTGSIRGGQSIAKIIYK